jgi:hypothetical protein
MERKPIAGNKRVPLRKLPCLNIVRIEIANNGNIWYACNHGDSFEIWVDL